VVCYDVLTGATLWVHEDTARYATTIAGEGPRATPTIAGNRVLTQGATGLLNCLDLITGAVIWRRDVVAEGGRELPSWGVAGSPLVVSNRVVVHAGATNERSRVAFDLESGQHVWGAGSGGMDYSSPTRARLAGRDQILIFTGSGVVSHDLGNGRVLWRHSWRGGHPHVTVPIVLPEDRVAISSGYGTGCEVIAVTVAGEVWTVKPVWKSIRLKSKFANMIFHAGHLYGLDDGILACLNATDGTLQWKDGRYGHGQLILAGDHLLVMAESGDVVLVEPNPVALRELARLSALRGKTWNPPALAGDLLLLRNDQQAACYRMPLAN
jgi:outer membrane protein assembly factor BamB